MLLIYVSLEKLKFDINSCIHKYGFDNNYCEFALMFKEWLTDDDFFVSFVKVEEVINEIIKDSNKVNKLSGKKELTDIRKRISINYQGKYVDIIMGEYGEKVLIGNKELFKLSIKDVDHYFDVQTVYGKDNKDNKVLKYFVTDKNVDTVNNIINENGDFISSKDSCYLELMLNFM